jgi:hypothetical protein
MIKYIIIATFLGIAITGCGYYIGTKESKPVIEIGKEWEYISGNQAYPTETRSWRKGDTIVVKLKYY